MIVVKLLEVKEWLEKLEKLDVEYVEVDISERYEKDVPDYENNVIKKQESPAVLHVWGIPGDGRSICSDFIEVKKDAFYKVFGDDDN